MDLRKNTNNNGSETVFIFLHIQHKFMYLMQLNYTTKVDYNPKCDFMNNSFQFPIKLIKNQFLMFF